uniref:ATPase AAA-type core domain-containing protein n=1 Tax=Magnetococcus massalia (strain MO-1) TaxID=451514 RepID=A0A1S7LK13_MAGMO|nr:Conserved protein of unknown function. Putative containing ATP-binding protein involved in virulence and ATP-dependent endonuclease of the OLD family domain [Candidatus Magnetococcus massalia]
MREIKDRGKRTTSIDAKAIKTEAKSLYQRSENEPVSFPVLCYYGTGRLWLEKRERQKSVDTWKPTSRFTGYAECLDYSQDRKRFLKWFKTNELATIQQGRTFKLFEAVRHAVTSMLPHAKRVYWDISTDELSILFEDGLDYPFAKLSDGYRNVLTMVADLAFRAALLNPHLGEQVIQEIEGTVLIDEIDLHLHPHWQRDIISSLLKTFPRIQFVATTHSPFIIQSIHPSNAVRLINLDDPSGMIQGEMSIEDVAEEIQGVDMPSRSHRYQEMIKSAEAYYALLEQGVNNISEEREALKQQLERLEEPFSENPAYVAFLKMKRVAAGFGEDKPE